MPSKHKIPIQSQHQILYLHKPIVKAQSIKKKKKKKNPRLGHTIAMNTTIATTEALTNSTSL